MISEIEMAKKSVSKFTYHITTTFYRTLCLCGLLWQVTKISINFFHFDTIKDIKVLMPEEISDTESVLNVCFENDEIIRRWEYPEILGVNNTFYKLSELDQKWIRSDIVLNMTVKERFNSIPKIPELFHEIRYIEEYLLGPKYCFQITRLKDIVIRAIPLSQVRSASFSRGKKFPLFDHRRLLTLNMRVHSGTYNTDIRSYAYHMENLEWPYQDNCKRYTDLVPGRDRLRAIVTCANLISMSRDEMLYGNIPITRNISSFEMYRINATVSEEDEDKCEKRYPNLDCSYTVHLTEASDPKYVMKPSSYPLGLYLTTGDGSDLSFVIKSKPRIDNIDYVTYVLGSLGAWLGFSFVAISPIPYILKIRTIGIENSRGTCTVDCKAQISILKNQIKESRISKQQLFMVMWKMERENRAAIDGTRKAILKLNQEFSSFKRRQQI